ncbi:hypothetical protein GCM10017778_13740 [Streptomyces vinaceus]|nr:hypothetical protein GCM10017778_13740 [Streptomyces vinaceus]
MGRGLLRAAATPAREVGGANGYCPTRSAAQHALDLRNPLPGTSVEATNDTYFRGREARPWRHWRGC